MAFIDFKGGKIAYDQSGKGQAIVFLHGFLETKEIWKDFSSNFPTQYQVVAIDLPGHGASSNFGYCHSMEFMAEVVMAVLKSLKIRRFHLIGHSMGGYVAMAVADKYPDNLRGLCLFHSTADKDSDVKKKERLKVIKVVQKDKNIFLREAIPNLFNRDKENYKIEIESLIKVAKNISQQGIIAALEGMRLRIDRQIILKFSPYPILYIIGKYDNVLSWQKLVAESELSENAQYVLLENSAHMGFIEESKICKEGISVFLRRKI